MVHLKHHFLFLSLLIIIPLSAQVKIQGEFLNAEDYDQLYLYEFFGRNFYPIDTIELNAGKFTMTYDEIERGFYRLGFEESKMINFILGEESFELKADLNDLLGSISFTNSVENQEYLTYLKFSIEYMRSAYQLDAAIRDILNQPDSLQDTIELSRLNEEKQTLNENRFNLLAGIKNNHSGTFIHKVASSSIFQNDKELFFSDTDFTDEELTRGDMLSSKLFYYFRKFVPSNLNDWNKEFQDLLSNTPKNSRIREFYYISYIELLNQAAANYVWDITNQYLEEYPNSKYFEYLLVQLPQKPPSIGDMAPEISLSDPTGNIFHLSSLKGQIVLVDFWASWCGPCRRENPNVVAAYEEYKEYGFTVLGVSLDRDKDRWLQAIEKDRLTWNHISDLKGWKSEGASIYKVRAIPAAFLIDKDGKIISKNLRGQELHNKLKEIFDLN